MGEFDPRDQRLAAGSSGGKYGFMQVGLSDKAASDFKDGMKSIQTAGDMGVYNQLIELITKLTSLSSDPRLEQIQKFFELYERFWRAAASEDAGAIAEKLFAPENVAAMKDFADWMYDLKQGLINSEKFRAAFLDWLDQSTYKYTKLGEEISKVTDDIGAQFKAMPAKFVQMMKDGFEDASSGLSNWFENWVEDMIEDAGG